MDKSYLCKLIFIFFLALNNYFINTLANYEQKKIQKKNQHTIIVLLHLYNLNLMDEFIEKINKFIKTNNGYNFYIKINIPVDTNIKKFIKFDKKISLLTQDDDVFTACKALAPYHSDKITYDNCNKLYTISEYLKEKLVLHKEKIQILFSENRGVDIGGFFLLLDQVIKQDLQHDYLVKLHTKTATNWRSALLSILSLDLNKCIPGFSCMYGPRRLCDNSNDIERAARVRLREILELFGLPEKEKFWFCPGTMFIVSREITDFLREYDMITLFNQLNLGYVGDFDGPKIEHGYERFFGYLMDWLRLNRYSSL